MAISATNGYFQVISDGEKLIILRGSGKERECFMFINPLLTAYRAEINRPVIDFQSFSGDTLHYPGLIDASLDLSFKGGEVSVVDKPLVMGVDIFDKLSVTDYLDIINEKIKCR